MRASLHIAGWLVAAGLAHAAPDPAFVPEVISPRPDSVSITIYRDLFALITETRTVELPEGPVTLSFDGVVDTLIPASAVVRDAGRPLEERNFDFDPLTPQSLFQKSVGRKVLLTRTHERTGKVTQQPATIVSANDSGVVLRTRDGHEALYCAGLSEHVTFASIPDGLRSTPRLSVRLAGGAAGRRTVRVSYLAHGFAWRSDYVARIGARPERMNLQGWLTLRNLTNTSFRDAQVQVVAGQLNLLDRYDRGTSLIGNTSDSSRDQLRLDREMALEEMLEEIEEATEDYDGTPWLLRGCFAKPSWQRREAAAVVDSITASDIGSLSDIEEVIVTGVRMSVAEREEFADYQLYRLPWRTDLAARQSKQAVFLDKRDVEFERFYAMRFDAQDFTAHEEYAPLLTLRFENRKSSGLGEPLPEGILRLFEPGPAGDVFAGECSLDDVAVNAPVEKAIAGAVDLHLEIEVDDEAQDRRWRGGKVRITDAQLHVLNAKGVPVTVEIRQQIDEDAASAKIMKASHRTTRKHGDFAWRLRVPGNSADTLTYRMRRVE